MAINMLDHNLYFQQQPVDIMGSIGKGLSLADMIQNRRLKQAEVAKQQRVENAFRQSLVPDAQGGFKLDRGLLLSKLAREAPHAYMQAQEQFTKQDLATQGQEIRNLLNISGINKAISDGSLKTDQFNYGIDKDKAEAEAKRTALEASQAAKGFVPEYSETLDRFGLPKIKKWKRDYSLKPNETKPATSKQKAWNERAKMLFDAKKAKTPMKPIYGSDVDEFGLKTIIDWKPIKSSGGGYENSEYYIKGLKFDPKSQLTATEIRKVKQDVGKVPSLISNLRKAQALLKNSSRKDWLDPDFQAKVNGYIKDAQLVYKSPAFANLGVLTGPDMSILEKVIPEPFSVRGFYMGPKDIADRYEETIQRVNRQVIDYLSPYGYTPTQEFLNPTGAQQQQQQGGSPQGEKPSWAE